MCKDFLRDFLALESFGEVGQVQVSSQVWRWCGTSEWFAHRRNKEPYAHYRNLCPRKVSIPDDKGESSSAFVAMTGCISHLHDLFIKVDFHCKKVSTSLKVFIVSCQCQCCLHQTPDQRERDRRGGLQHVSWYLDCEQYLNHSIGEENQSRKETAGILSLKHMLDGSITYHELWSLRREDMDTKPLKCENDGNNRAFAHLGSLSGVIEHVDWITNRVYLVSHLSYKNYADISGISVSSWEGNVDVRGGRHNWCTKIILSYQVVGWVVSLQLSRNVERVKIYWRVDIITKFLTKLQ